MNDHRVDEIYTTISCTTIFAYIMLIKLQSITQCFMAPCNCLSQISSTWTLSLTHLPPSTTICVNQSGQHWFRQWLVAFWAPSHYLNQCCDIVNWTLTNKLQWQILIFLRKCVWKCRLRKCLSGWHTLLHAFQCGIQTWKWRARFLGIPRLDHSRCSRSRCSHYIGYVKWECYCLYWISIITTSDISVLVNDIKFGCIDVS